MDDFFKVWFQGFADGLDTLEEGARETLLKECGKECAKSFPLGLYESVWEKTKDISAFFSMLTTEFDQIRTYEIKKDRIYQVEYRECTCDLYTLGYLHTGALCECSRCSLAYILGRILVDKHVSVCLVESILRGATRCLLEITID